MGFVGRGLWILEVSMCWRKASGGSIPAHPWLPPLCFQDWVTQFLPSPLLVSITEQVNVNIYLYIAISMYASQEVIVESWRALSIVTNQQSISGLSVANLKHRKQQKIMSYISLCSSSPVSSIGMKVVAGHRAGGILKNIFKSIHSLHSRCSWSFSSVFILVKKELFVILK